MLTVNGKGRKGAFTLIELLVVITIIALLVSILMPALSRARESGKRIRCLGNLKSLAAVMYLYASANNDNIPSGSTEGKYAWVDHSGGLEYYNIDNDPAKEHDQEEAISRGLLWKFADKQLEIFRCPTARLGQVRSYSMPDSFAYDNPGILSALGVDSFRVIRNLTRVKFASERMMFIDEGWATPASWSIMYNSQQWWDAVPDRHSNGTTLAFIDGHAEYWKWQDRRTVEFAKEASELENPNDASYWRKVETGNEDITRLVRAVWGDIGWDQNGR